MSKWTPRRLEIALRVTAWLALAAGIGVQTDWGRLGRGEPPPLADSPANFAPPELTEPFRLRPIDQYGEMIARPVFVATRRPAPPAPAVAEASQGSMQKDQFVLTGTTISPDGKYAFLLEKSGNKSRVVAEGKEINGITVRQVASDKVVLAQGDETEILMLKTIKPPPRPVPVQAPRGLPNRIPAPVAAEPPGTARAPSAEPGTNTPGAAAPAGDDATAAATEQTNKAQGQASPPRDPRLPISGGWRRPPAAPQSSGSPQQ